MTSQTKLGLEKREREDREKDGEREEGERERRERERREEGESEEGREGGKDPVISHGMATVTSKSSGQEYLDSKLANCRSSRRAAGSAMLLVVREGK